MVQNGLIDTNHDIHFSYFQKEEKEKAQSVIPAPIEPQQLKLENGSWVLLAVIIQNLTLLVWPYPTTKMQCNVWSRLKLNIQTMALCKVSIPFLVSIRQKKKNPRSTLL